MHNQWASHYVKQFDQNGFYDLCLESLWFRLYMRSKARAKCKLYIIQVLLAVEKELARINENFSNLYRTNTLITTLTPIQFVKLVHKHITEIVLEYNLEHRI